MTQCPTSKPDETLRLNALHQMRVVDTPIEERYERITRIAKRALGVEIVAISLVDEDHQYFKSIQGLEETRTARDISFCGHTIQGSDPLVIPDATQDPRFADNPLVTGEPGIRAYAGIPIESVDGRCIGALCAIHGRPHAFSETDILILTDLAHIAASELSRTSVRAVGENYRSALSPAQRAERIDPVTRVWNAVGMRELIAHHLTTAHHAAYDTALLKINLDGFTAINEQHGREAGDEALAEAARRMIAALRGEDAFGRLEGDEFVTLLVGCGSADHAESIATRLLHELIQLPILTGQAVVELSASVGGVHLPQGSALDPQAVLDQADQAMARVKDAGGNCVAVNTLRPRNT
ncbi:MAG: sensor domain-containing diguanylate cyclase [Planctomycetota bacterium]